MRRFLAGIAMFFVVAVVFSGAVPNEFVRIDDYEYIVMNPHIKDGLDADSAKWSLLSAGYAANWHPLTWMSHAADISLAKALGVDCRGEDDNLDLFVPSTGAFPKLVHLENVLLHAVNAVLLFFVLVAAVRLPGTGRNPVGDMTLALLVLLWALHPLRVEVVAWASERKELLSVFFMLLTVLVYMKRGAAHGRAASRACYVFALLAFALALLAKPVAVSLPVVLFALDWIVERDTFRRSAVRTSPFFLLSACVSALTVFSQEEALHGAHDWTLVNRVLAVVEAPVIYLRQTLWPVDLTIDYALLDWTTWPYFVAGVCLLVLMAATLAWYLVRRLRGRDGGWSSLFAFAVAWIYIGLVPMLGIVKVGYEPHNDRYTYWIACGASVVIAMALSMLPRTMRERLSTVRTTVYASVFAVLVVLSFATFRLTRTWKDSESLFMRAVMYNHDVGYAHMLAEVMAVRYPEKQALAVDIMREVLSRRRTPEARAALAYQLAAHAPGESHSMIDGTMTNPFAEARMFAGYALEDPSKGRTAEFACAALAFADFREGKYESAMTWMNRAVECGYEPKSHNVDIKAWKGKVNVPK